MNSDVTRETAEGEGLPLCPGCGTPYAAPEDGCPVCLLRQAMQPERTVEDNLVDGHFDHYELVRCADGTFDELGRGAMGVTYRALDTVLGHAVALKVIDPRAAANPNVQKRFLREARAAAQLRHAHVASVFYYGVRKSDGQCFYASELVEGETLEARMRRVGTLSIPEALKIVEQVTRALLAAEVQGVVHRDLKPANLMLTHGPEFMVKVIDLVWRRQLLSQTRVISLKTASSAHPPSPVRSNLPVTRSTFVRICTRWVSRCGRC
jgi:serine/threonine protein kinase